MFSLCNWKAARAAIANWFIVLLGLVSAQAIPALALILVARQVLPTDYAQYLSSYGLLSLLIVVPNYGMDIWLLAQGNQGALGVKGVWRSAIQARVGLLAIWIAGVILLGIFLPRDTFPLEVMLPTALGLAFDSLSLLSYSGLRTLARHGQVTILQTISSFALLGVTLALPLQPGHIALFAIARGVISALTAAAAGVTAGKHMTSPSAPSALREIMRAARPFMLGDLAVSIYTRSDMTLISLLVGVAGASIYGPAINLINVTFLVPNALALVVLPILSRSFMEARQRFVRVGVAQLFAQTVTGLGISLGIFWLAPLLVPIVFGAAYEPSVPILRLLSPVPFLTSLNFGVGTLLTSGNRQAQRTTVQMLCTLFNTVGTLICIFPFGIGGVAVVHTLGEMFRLGGYALATSGWWVHSRK